MKTFSTSLAGLAALFAILAMAGCMVTPLHPEWRSDHYQLDRGGHDRLHRGP